jgi:hypothetical protein
MLQQHVLGVIVHGQPHTYYLYTFNDNLKGDANMNIEGIRRTLLKHLEGGRRMPRILYVQADNASDNKNFAMIAFLAVLAFSRLRRGGSALLPSCGPHPRGH